MKKLFLGLGAFLVLLVLGLVLVPSVIDWNGYKAEISEQVKKATGRDLFIAGDIEMSLLPKPILVAENVSLSSIENATEPDLVSLRSVEVRIALAPLLGGNIRIETVRLVEPRIYLEVLSDGRTTWSFDLPAGSSSDVPQSNEEASAAPDTGLGIILDSFEVIDGTLIYRDAASGTEETVSDIDLSIAAASLTAGPYQIDGSLVARDMRLAVDADIGDIVEARTFPLNLKLGVGGDSAQLALTGTVLGLDAAPRYRGDFAITSRNIGALVSALSEGASLPEPLGQSLEFKGRLDASASQIAVEELGINFGGATGTGSVTGTLNGVPRIAVELRIDSVDADPWLIKSGPVDTVPGSGTPPSETTGSTAVPPPADSATVADASFAIPDNLDASLILQVGEVRLRGDRASDVVVDVALGGGEVTLNQLSLNAPGGTRAQLFGFLTAQDGKPAFDGELTASVADVPSLLAWADVSISGLNPGKPEKIDVKTAVSGLGETLAVKELELKVDETTVRGAANVVLRERLGVGASINIDRLNLDTYLAQSEGETSQAPSSQTSASSSETPTPASDAQPDIGGMLRPLTTLDANVRASVGELTYSGIPIKGIEADLGLANGTLTIGKFTIADAVSVGASVDGVLTDLGSLPVARDVKLKANVGDPSRLLDLLGVTLPFAPQNLGKIASDVRVNGSILAPDLKGVLSAFAGSLDFDGRVSPLTPNAMYDMALHLKHSDAANFIRRLGVGYRPSGSIGNLDVKANVSGSPTNVAFKNLAAGLGNVRVSGNGSADLSGPRPRIVFNGAGNDLVVDPFIPAQQSGMRQNDTLVPAPVRFDVPDGGNPLFHLMQSVSSRWARTPIDLSALQALDADITFDAPSIKYQVYNLTDASLRAALSNGTLNVSELAASIFGGAFQSSATVNVAGARPQLAGILTLGDMDIGQAANAVGVPGASGTLTTRVDVSSTGNSLADWVQALNGQGAFQVSGVKARRSLTDVPIIGVTFAPLLQIFELLNSGLGSIIGRGAQTGLGETDITSTFNIANGVVSTRDMKILSNIYNGNIAGDISLPAWQMDVSGDIAVDQGVVGALLSGVARIPNQIPFTVKGDIDNPNVNLRGFGSSSGGAAIPIPGLDRLEEKVPGVGGLIQGILGGGRSSTSQPSENNSTSSPPSQQPPSQEPPSQQPQQQQTNPAEQLLRGIFGN